MMMRLAPACGEMSTVSVGLCNYLVCLPLLLLPPCHPLLFAASPLAIKPTHIHDLQGPGFDADVRRPTARIFTWINRLLTSKSPLAASAGPIAALGPAKQAVARSALLNMLSTNAELADVFVDQCYDSQPTVSRVYFQVRRCELGWPCSVCRQGCLL